MAANAAPAISEGELTDAPASSSASQEQQTRKRKRKCTNTVRREEKEELQMQVQQLRSELEQLKSRVFGVPTDEELASDQRCKAQMVENRRIRRTLLSQQFALGPLQALLDELALTELETGSPLHQFLHLQSDWQSRHETLKAAKVAALHRAKWFLQQRRPGWDPLRQTRQERTFETSTGDACVVRWSTMHFERARTVRRGFETLQRFFSDLEIRISDQLSFITVREDDDDGGTEIPQNRFVSTTQSGYKIESNSVFFSEYEDKSAVMRGERGCGMIVHDFVDVDDRHPYYPTDRIRRDVSSVFEVTSVQRPQPQQSSTTAGPMPEDIVIVLTHCVFVKLHRPVFDVQPAVWSQLRQDSENWIKILQPATIEIVE